MTCPLCLGHGFVWLKGRETHATHWSSGGHHERLVHRLVSFRAPCECEVGARWQREHERAPSKK